ncbi:MAG: ribose 5-phosphate isomerase B [Candidatus Delongbacteria bacterium]|jgi:ribose 5-phosphate isomerase B|nr:ribose 5-phosphate isomerase B [Candidatus Delongbacteria bacterium]
MNNSEKIFLGSDHGGFELKEKIKKYLDDKGYCIEDLGCYSEESVDYPEFGRKVALAVVENKARGIIVCGTGIGISMAANKVKGARAGLCHSVEYAKLTRQHNDANVLSMGGRFIDHELAIEVTDTFLNTEFEGGRHQKRVDDIDNV